MLIESLHEHLAEFYLTLTGSSSDDYIYCLCSRNIIRVNSEDNIFNQDRSVTLDDAEGNSGCFSHSSTELQLQSVNALTQKENGDVISCYCSDSPCSDNSIKGASQSDCGAHSSELLYKWNEYWTKYGDKLVYESWIKKYSEYIDPTFLQLDSALQTSDHLLSLEDSNQENESIVTHLSNSSEVSDSLTNITPLTLSELSTEGSSSSSSDAEKWHELWVDHYNTQYNIVFQSYLANLSVYPNNWALAIDDQSQVSKSLCNKNRSEKTVGYLLKDLNSLKMDNESSIESDTDSQEPLEVSSKQVDDKHFDSVYNVSSPCNETTYSSLADRVKPKKFKSDDKLKNAFELIGIAYSGESVQEGSVVYRKRKIRAQNRALNLKKPRSICLENSSIEHEFNGRKEESEIWHLADTGESKPDIFENDDNSSGDFFSASETIMHDPQKKSKRKKIKKGIPKEIIENDKLLKYWHKRYSLFSLFDEGIQLDEESWYSVTPEQVSKSIAERCRCDLIIDAFCGAGGNTIQFALTCERVIAIDIDPHKIQLAKHNARIYGVEDRIEFIIGDYLQLAPKLKADVVFLSPPWGGIGYASEPTFSLDKILPPFGGGYIYSLAAKITPNVAMFMPRNVISDELIELGGPGSTVELEQNFLKKKLIAVTAYFGELVGTGIKETCEY